MGSVDYWLGVATPFALAFAGWLGLMIFAWITWWFRGGRGFRGGWGYVHEVETIYLEHGGWGRVQHTHYGPPDTPHWLGRLLEPIRIRLCLRKPEYRRYRPTSDGPS